MKHSGIMLLILAATLTVAVSAARSEPVTKLYVPTGTSNEIVIYGSDGENLIRRYNAEFEVDRAFSKPDNSEVWLLGSQTTDCEVVEAAADRQIVVFDTEINVEKIVFSPDGLYGFAVGYSYSEAGRQVFAVDFANYQLLYPLTEVNDVGDVAVTPDSRKVWVSSVSAGTITSFSIPSFERIQTVYVGPEPVDLESINNGEVLLIVCRGLAMGERGGSQLVAVSATDGEPLWINNQLGSSLSELAITSDATTLVLTYHTPMIDPPANIREYSGRLSDKGLAASADSHFLLGARPQAGLLNPRGNSWIGCDADAGIITIDLESNMLQESPAYVDAARPYSIALVTIDVDQGLAAINAELEAQATSDLFPEKLLELAYLQKTAGSNNAVVTTYRRIIEDYPASYAAIEAGLEMSKFTYNDSFFVQSAEYAVAALTAFSDYLAATREPRTPPVSDLKLTVERLAMLSQQYGKNYLEDVAKTSLSHSVQHPILADLYFSMGYHLYRINKEGTARKCFAEVRNQLAAINDPNSVRDLSARLALAGGESAAYYKIKKMKKGATLDGDLGEWKDVNSLQMSAAGGWFYGQAGWDGNEDLSGVIQIAYNESDVFFAGEVFDDSLVNLPDDTGDMIRFMIDLRPLAGNYFLRDDDCTSGCFQFSIIAPTSTQPKARLATNMQAPYEIASARIGDGYNFELRLPLVAFGKWFTGDLERIGLGIELVDCDNPDDAESCKALGFVLPAASPGGAPRPTLFGVAELQ